MGRAKPLLNFPAGCSFLPMQFKKEEAGKQPQLPCFLVTCDILLTEGCIHYSGTQWQIRDKVEDRESQEWLAAAICLFQWVWRPGPRDVEKMSPALLHVLTRRLDTGRNGWFSLTRESLSHSWSPSPGVAMTPQHAHWACYRQDTTSVTTEKEAHKHVSFDFVSTTRRNQNHFLPLHSLPLPC